MAVFLNRNKRPQAAPIEVAELLLEKPPPSHTPAIPASADVPLPRMVAAALSAAVTSAKLIGDELHSQGAQAGRKDQLEPQPLSGWEREGGAFL